LYEWDALCSFLAEILSLPKLYRYADPLGALNLAVMGRGMALGWHFDQTDFVSSLSLQTSEGGGEFQVVPAIRTTDDERYDLVAGVLDDRSDLAIQSVPMEPGTLVVFKGRHSIHRVRAIEGARKRLIALLAYDAKPGTDSTERVKLTRYGRQPGAPPPFPNFSTSGRDSG
jgi:hypothetical protein